MNKKQKKIGTLAGVQVFEREKLTYKQQCIWYRAKIDFLENRNLWDRIFNKKF